MRKWDNEKSYDIALRGSDGNVIPYPIENMLIRRVAISTPLNEVLDKIKAEIEAIEEGITSYHNDRPRIFKDEALQIIDKYKENEVEE